MPVLCEDLVRDSGLDGYHHRQGILSLLSSLSSWSRKRKRVIITASSSGSSTQGGDLWSSKVVQQTGIQSGTFSLVRSERKEDQAAAWPLLHQPQMTTSTR